MTLDERHKILYFIDGSSTLMALDLNTKLLTSLLSTKQHQQHQQLQLQLQQQQQAQNQRIKTNDGANRCRRSDLRISLAEYKPLKLSSLTWSPSDSSLYFIDQNTVFALRQDQSLEIIAFGSRPARADFIQSLPVSCLSDKQRRLLGQIKSILVDETNRELLLAHQWIYTDDKPNSSYKIQFEDEGAKVSGRYYMAKIKLGIRTSREAGMPARVVDLHSSSVWSKNLMKLLGQEVNSSIDWIAQSSNLLSAHSRSPRPKSIPFIHLSGGFERIDSIEINSDGSIFVLDSGDSSLRIISDYSPNEFNQMNNNDEQSEDEDSISRALNQNNNNFDRSSYQSGSMNEEVEEEKEGARRSMRPMFVIGDDLASAQHQPATTETNTILRLRNPLTKELMDFHGTSGLLRSLTSFLGEGRNGKEKVRYELQYQLTTGTASDEDDRNDFQVQRAAIPSLKHLGLAEGSSKLKMGQVMARLSKILDSKFGYELDLMRTYSSRSRTVIKSISLNQEPIAQITTNFEGLLTGLYPMQSSSASANSNTIPAVELIYDGTTNLLREELTKYDIATNNPSSRFALGQPTSSSQFIYPTNTELRIQKSSSSTSNRQRLKRIVYDQMFFHYCDLYYYTPGHNQ